MKSVSDIFDALGGPASVARSLGIRPSTASEMKRRGSIPAEHWRNLVTVARRRRLSEITTDLLAEIHARPALGEAGVEPEEARDAGDRADEHGHGHFSRFMHLRRSHFASTAEIDDHVRALREEWDRR